MLLHITDCLVDVVVRDRGGNDNLVVIPSRCQLFIENQKFEIEI